MKEEKSFEELMDDLENIAEELESDKLNLDDSMKKFEEGMKISKLCNEKLENAAVKKEFSIADDVNYVVAIKLTAIDSKVNKDEVEISTDGNRAYDAEHLNGSDYTFIILEAVPNKTTTISVRWNKGAEELVYVIYFDKNLELK